MIVLRRQVLQVAPGLLLAGCAALPGNDPVQVQVVDMEPLDGQGLELRFLCKLRVQNPNGSPIAFRGAAIDLQVRGSSLAYGVSDVEGTIPPFGEAIVAVPVTVSAMGIARQAFDILMEEGEPRPIEYVLRGKLGGAMFGAVRFEARGALNLWSREGRRPRYD